MYTDPDIWEYSWVNQKKSLQYLYKCDPASCTNILMNGKIQDFYADLLIDYWLTSS